MLHYLKNMNKHTRAFYVLCFLAFIVFYSAGLPAMIVDYALDNNWQGFSHDVPWRETYSVFTMAWLTGHALGIFLLYATYMLCYGCWRE